MLLLGAPATPNRAALGHLLARYGLTLAPVPDGAPIPGSFWGEPEAGLVGRSVHARADTPLHSALHESCHAICMDPARREALDTDAGGTTLEECGVCYLSIVLAEEIPGFGRARMLRDMDDWGYSFRLGSARAWFESDAGDAREWLHRHGLLDTDDRPLWTCRGTSPAPAPPP